MNAAHLLSVRDLTVEYRSGRSVNRVLHEVSVALEAGRTLGLVGESGSGKTTLGRAILGLVPAREGRIEFDGRDITKEPRRGRRLLSREIQVVFQDPYGSLNPSFTIDSILTEPLMAQGVSRRDSSRRVGELLDSVGLPSGAGRRYPREFSGGQRQRVAIARALALRPRLIVCDEPVSALDLTTQARVLDLFLDIQEETGVAYLFISHDLDVVRHVSHEIAVMRQGRIVEQGPAGRVFASPQSDYTRLLLLSSPIADPAAQRERRAQLADLMAGRV